MAGIWLTKVSRASAAVPGPAKIGSSNLITPPTGYTLKRTRLEPKFFVAGTPSAGATGFQIDWWQNVVLTVAVAVTEGSGAAPAPGDPHTNPPTNRWLIWDALHFEVEVYDLGTPYLQLRAIPNPQTLESFGQELISSTLVSGLWMAWHLDDPSNLIGTTTSLINYQWGYTVDCKTLWMPTP